MRADGSAENLEKYKQKRTEVPAFGLWVNDKNMGLCFWTPGRGILGGQVTDLWDSVTCLHWGLRDAL